MRCLLEDFRTTWTIGMIGLVLTSSGCAMSRQLSRIRSQESTEHSIVEASDLTEPGESVRTVATTSLAETDAEHSADLLFATEEDEADSGATQTENERSLRRFDSLDHETGNSLPESDAFTLEQLEQLALANNPSIAQASTLIAQSKGLQYQVGLTPNPIVGYFGEEIGNDGAGGLHGAFVSQTFVRGDKLAWNRQVLGQDVNRALWLADAQRHRVLTDIRLQFYAALEAQQRGELAREFREVVEQAVDLSRQRIEAKVGTRADLLQSQIQLTNSTW